MQSKRGFTLIELLVVISIIALLISILLPALGSARESALSITCANQIKQNHLGVMAYAADFKDWIVPSQINKLSLIQSEPAFDNDTAKWGQILLWQRYATDPGQNEFTSRILKGGQFYCPTVESSGSYHGTYGINQAITGHINYNTDPIVRFDWYTEDDGWKRISDLDAPGVTYMIGDSARQDGTQYDGLGEYTLRGKGDKDIPHMRHMNDTVWNVVFGDGHLETLDDYVFDGSQPADAIEWRGTY